MRWYTVLKQNKATAIGSIVALVVACPLLLSPKFATFGVESAFVFGLALPPISIVLALHRRRQLEAGLTLGDKLSATLSAGMVPVHVAAFVQLAALLWVPVCEPGEGILYFLLGPFSGCALACIAGLTIGELTPQTPIAGKRNIAPLATYGGALLIPIGALLFGVAEFFLTPAIYVFGQFAGWFPGTLYDVGTTIPTRYWTYRLTTCLLAAGLIGLLSAGLRERAAFSLVAMRSQPKRTLFSIACLGGFVLAQWFAVNLGHRSSSASVADALGRSVESDRCILLVPQELPVAERERLAQDCDFRVAQAERFLGVQEPRKIRAYFFRNAQEKQLLMGARDTFIAKPWLGEVYLQHRPWPHPVLAHEIAHVVARNTASGPLGLGGQLGGYLPDGGLIEGLAVATAWTTPNQLTAHQWSRALLELNKLPPLESMFGLSFLSLPARGAYASAGSFLRFLHQEHGATALQTAYRTGDLTAATGKSTAELERAWRNFLRTVELPEDTLALAELRFSGKGFFSAICPHKVAKLKQAMLLSRAAGDLPDVKATCEAILRVDPADIAARSEMLRQRSVRSVEEATAATAEALELGIPPAATPALVLHWADEAWRRGDTTTAGELVGSVLEMPLDENTRRSVEVRSIGLHAPKAEQAALFSILVGPPGQNTSTALVVFHAQQLAVQRSDGLGAYLLARQLWFGGSYGEALGQLEDAVARGLPTEALHREARRLLVTLLVAEHRNAQAMELLDQWRQKTNDEASIAFIDEWTSRAKWQQDRQ